MSYYPDFHFLDFSFGYSRSCYVFAEWKEFSPGTLLRPSDFAFEEWVGEWLPTVGGRPYAVREPVDNQIAGVRIPPHPAPP